MATNTSLLLFAFCIIAVGIVVPLGVYRSNSARHAVSAANEELFAQLRAKQKDLMKTILAAQQSLAILEANVEHETRRINDEEKAAQSELQSAQAEKVAMLDQLKTLQADLDLQIGSVLKDTQGKIAEAQQVRVDTNLRFIVKWHAGKDGVKTSQRFATESEARNKYDAVGDLAKKLLMFNGQTWIVQQDYGGENWLACMTNDAEPNDGACKSDAK